MKQDITTQNRQVSAVASIFLLAISTVHCAPFSGAAYEGFDYAVDSDIRGQSGGSGWVGPWSGTVSGPEMHAQSKIAEGSLDSPFLVAPATGNRAFMIGSMDPIQRRNATVARSITDSTIDAGSVWVSFVAQRESPGVQDINFRLLNQKQEALSVRMYQDFRLEGGTTMIDGARPGYGRLASSPSLIVLHVEFDVESKEDPSKRVDRATMYIDPHSEVSNQERLPTFNIGTDTIIEGPAGTLGFNGIELMAREVSSKETAGYGAASFDEIRVGTSFESVAGD